MNPTVKFSQNWNNKLSNPIFTTIRFNSHIHEGMDVDVILKDKYIFLAEVIERKDIKFGDIPPQIVAIDTGYPYKESLEIFKNFSRSKSTDDLKQLPASILLLRRIKTKQYGAGTKQ